MAATDLRVVTPPGPVRSTSRPFRRDLQALRALAVALVVVFHLVPRLAPGGYVGVDVFFVVSGFLITSHLLAEHETHGRISLVRFYARRARRLLPAAFVVLAVAIVAVTLLVPASAQRQNFVEIAASALYVENWVLAANSVDYLNATATPSIVQHFWSLSAEEQFYFVWPVLLVVAAWASASRSERVRRTVWIVVLGVVFAASLIFSIASTATSPSWAYFVSPTRAWEFAAGGLLALAVVSFGRAFRALPRAAGIILTWAGLAAIVASAFVYDTQTPFPGIAALLPVAGTIAVIAAGDLRSRWSPMVVGGVRPVQYLGDISYSVYLWHWPLVAIFVLMTARSPRWWEAAALVAGTIVLAAASKRFVEDPFLRRHSFVARPGLTLIAVAVGMALLVGGSAIRIVQLQSQEHAAIADQERIEQGPCFGANAVEHPSCGDPRAVPAELPTAFASTDYADTTLGDCGQGITVAPIVDSFECSFGDPNSDRLVVIIGDSHAGHWLPAFQSIDSTTHIVSMLRSSCPFTEVTPLEGGVFQEKCEQWKQAVRERVRELRPDVVVVASLTPAGYAVAGFELGPEDAVEEGYAKELKGLGESGAQVVVLKDTPYMAFDVPQCLGGTSGGSGCPLDRATALDANYDPLWAAVGEVPGVSGVDLTDVLCDAKTCYSVTGDVIIFRDRHHFTATFARSMAPALLDRIERAGVEY